MHSLYHALLAQHSRQLTTVRCAAQTITQLHTYFEDVVLENNLSALVIENLPTATERPMRELARVREVGRAARHSFFFVSPEDELNNLPLRANEHDRAPMLIKRASAPSGMPAFSERFVVVADARFSALLAAVRNEHESTSSEKTISDGDDVIWTFEPNIVYSALEYLMARMTAERSLQAAAFCDAVRKCMPKATSLQLTVAVTTKLARLLQEQAVREVAVGRIATALRNSLELPSILQTTVDEVGRALGVQHCALRVEAASTGESEPLTHYYFRDGEEPEAEQVELESDLNAYSVRLGNRLHNYVLDGNGATTKGAAQIRPLVAVPLIYHERFTGVVVVRSDDSRRVWQESEILLLRTVADQVTVAVNHARLFKEMQQQALTDALTGCVNRRSFEMQMNRDLQLATRLRQPLTLVMLDIDHFKRVNDSFGHKAGDIALQTVARILRAELRGIDTAARYGGEEFAIILPQANADGAKIVAERLRRRIEETEVPEVGRITASFGVATFPVHATNQEQLVSLADGALYEAKRQGRNRVSTAGDQTHTASTPTEQMFEVASAELFAPTIG